MVTSTVSLPQRPITLTWTLPAPPDEATAQVDAAYQDGYAGVGCIVAVPEITSAETLLACYGPSLTSNEGEYRAALDALRWIYHQAGWRGPVTVYSDSQLMCRQFSGAYACNAPHLQPLLQRLRVAATRFQRLTFVWIPRERNTRADALSRHALYRGTRRMEQSA